jgi:hypothetical protein
MGLYNITEKKLMNIEHLLEFEIKYLLKSILKELEKINENETRKKS